MEHFIDLFATILLDLLFWGGFWGVFIKGMVLVFGVLIVVDAIDKKAQKE